MNSDGYDSCLDQIQDLSFTKRSNAQKVVSNSGSWIGSVRYLTGRFKRSFKVQFAGRNSRVCSKDQV